MLFSHDCDKGHEWRESGAARACDLVMGVGEDWEEEAFGMSLGEWMGKGRRWVGRTF